MAWLHAQPLLLRKSSLFRLRPPGSGLPRMASNCRWLPGLTSSHAQRAPRFGAAGIAVAVGSRVAHRVLSTTRAGMDRRIRRSTPAPASRQRPSLTPARTRLRSTWVQTVRIRVITDSRDSADQVPAARTVPRGLRDEMHHVEAGSDGFFWPAVSAKELKATDHPRNQMLRLRYLVEISLSLCTTIPTISLRGRGGALPRPHRASSSAAH